MEVVGRHALLFDDDASSAFVNSREALVEWNSLLIDRYDVRHLLHSLPPLTKRRRQSNPDEFELDQIRFQDLPPPTDDQSSIHEYGGAETADGDTYRAVSFSYGNTDVSSEAKNPDVPDFLPPFPVPQSLLESLPPTEKLHQIMARTAIFVSEHGGQSEIVLRVKQGNNPTFGFLMPEHHLHAYFRFLVEHPDVLKSDKEGKPEIYMKTDKEQKQAEVAGEALSLLGSVYGEDEDGGDPTLSESDKATDKRNVSSVFLDHEPELPVSSGYSTRVDPAAAVDKNSHPTDKGNVSMSKKFPPRNSITSTTGLSRKKDGGALNSLPGSLTLSQVSTPSSGSMVDPLIAEPPTEIKRMMDKIVEFVLKNGKEFEAVLIEQDRTSGRFPFLLPSNLYHSYYLKLIQESKQGGKRSSLDKGTETSSNGYSSHDLAYDPDQKEKFRMVIAGSKRDAQEATAPKLSTQEQYGMSVDTVAAILQAATRRGPKTKATVVDSVQQGIGSDDSSFGALSPSAIELSDVSVGKKTSLASEADSSEVAVGLTKEQKQKAERLKRAKMFAAIIKSGGTVAVPQMNDGPAAEPPATERKDDYSEIIAREREGSSVPVGVDKRRREDSEDDKERRSSKRHHYRSRARVDYDEDEDKDHKHSRKKHRSHHSSSHRDASRRRRHSSSKEEESRHNRHKYHDSSSSGDEKHHHKSSRSMHKPSKERKIESETGRVEVSSVDLINDSKPLAAQQTTGGATEISDDLRAKVRAMLLATM